MREYLKQLQKVLGMREGEPEGFLITDKDGYVEFYKDWGGYFGDYTDNFLRDVIGMHILEVFPELEGQCSIMECLRTGKVVMGGKQTVYWDKYEATIMTVSYPIIIDGRVEGCIDTGPCLGVKVKGADKDLDAPLYVLDDIITQDAKMRELKEKILRTAVSQSTVLIYGETGTGKELVAQAVHTAGRRRKKPFISQNCGAIPANLLESIFFGTEKGSFTGAESRKGLFELAAGGTLFLDEINSMDPGMQVKLLKALEEKKVRRVGGTTDIHFDVRIVCATNENPEALVKAGKLREDLYYRIGVVKLIIPPLREREGDILLLTDYFIQLYNRQMNREVKGMSRMVRELFLSHRWPGNVRELKNTIESAFNLVQGDTILIGDVRGMWKLDDLLPDDSDLVADQSDILARLWQEGGLPRNAPAGTAEDQAAGMVLSCPRADILACDQALETALAEDGLNLQARLEQWERHVITQVLKQEPQLKRAAQKLAMSPQKLQYRMERLGAALKSSRCGAIMRADFAAMIKIF